MFHKPYRLSARLRQERYTLVGDKWVHSFGTYFTLTVASYLGRSAAFRARLGRGTFTSSNRKYASATNVGRD